MYIMASNVHRGKQDVHKNIPKYFYVAFFFFFVRFALF